MRGLTHTQFEELRTYEHGNPSWREGGHSTSLLWGGWLLKRPEGFAQITERGMVALTAYRERWKVPA